MVGRAIEQHREHADDGGAHGDRECLLSTLLRIPKEGDNNDDGGDLTMANVKAVILRVMILRSTVVENPSSLPVRNPFNPAYIAGTPNPGLKMPIFSPG
uniref:Uncharacterized protein n=1 Tax=Oryza glumipatula TaxID=40148 RepID=A0A0D9ZA43_9ORYZ